MFTLYRAVTQTELNNIRLLEGSFRDSKHQTGEKGFFFQLGDAQAFAAKMTAILGETHVVVMTEASNEVVARSRPHHAAGEGSGVYLQTADLVVLSPAEEVTS